MMKRFIGKNIILIGVILFLVVFPFLVIASSKSNSTVRASAEEKITITEFSIPVTNYYPDSITSGSDGNLS
jgi:hypothetical protein